MHDMHDVFVVGIPLIAIIAGILFQPLRCARSSPGDSRGFSDVNDLQKDVNDVRKEMSDIRKDVYDLRKEISTEFKEFCKTSIQQDARIDNLENK